MKRLLTFLSAFLILSGCGRGPSKLELPSLIGDNMLLQQNAEATIWGRAVKGQTIRIKPSWGNEISTRAGEDNKWKVKIPSPATGGPYTMQIEASDTSIMIQNILCGEVWFCSGQSNMEMPLEGWPPKDTIMYSAETIRTANIPEIRLFNVQKRVSGKPLDVCTGKWEVCSPGSVKQFSATAFFFGRKVHEQLKVPVGLIESAWGGTPSEAWTSSRALIGAGEFVSEINAIKESAPLLASYQTWLQGHKQLPLKPAGDDQWRDLDFGDSAAISSEFDDSSWPVMNLPSLFEKSTGDFDGAVWFRKKIEVPASFKGRDLILSLGPIDDMDCTWFNGELVGSTQTSGQWQNDRNYNVPGKLVKAGSNSIAVRVLDTQGGGGIWGNAGSMKVSLRNNPNEKISIEGEWKYQPVAQLEGNKFYIFDLSKNDFFSNKRPVTVGPNTPSSLFNGMLNPVRNYAIKGAIWYQGEANVGRADQYSKIFPLMIRDWRETWNIGDFSFYFVQIAPYVYSNADSTDLPLLREAQTKVLELPKTGMVVTLDIATVMNIHPPFKKEVGERLACLALSGDYGKQAKCSGPVLRSVVRDGRILKLQFDNTGTGLKAKNNLLSEFEIAGQNMKFVKASAEIRKNEVWVESRLVSEPVTVRYCWRNGAVASLFNSDGLAASQFMAKSK